MATLTNYQSYMYYMIQNMIWVWSYHSNPSPPIFAQRLSGWNGLRMAGAAPCFEVGPGESRKLQGQVGGGWTWGKSVQVVSSHGVPTFFLPWSVLGSMGFGRVRIFWPWISPWLCDRKCNWTQQPAKWSTCDMASDWVSHITSNWERDKRLDHPTLYMIQNLQLVPLTHTVPMFAT